MLLIRYLHYGDNKRLKGLCAEKILYQYGTILKKGWVQVMKEIRKKVPPVAIRKITPLEYRTEKIWEGQTIVVGSYRITCQTSSRISYFLGVFTVFLQHTTVIYLQIQIEQEEPSKKHRIKEVNEDVHFIEEMDILYVECLQVHHLLFRNP